MPPGCPFAAINGVSSVRCWQLLWAGLGSLSLHQQWDQQQDHSSPSFLATVSAPENQAGLQKGESCPVVSESWGPGRAAERQGSGGVSLCCAGGGYRLVSCGVK